jgi:hypothetical protein
MEKKLFWPALLLALPLLEGCAYGILGKKTTQTLDTSITASVAKLRTDAVQTINETRDTLLNFLRYNSEKEAHDLSVGLLQGTIGYLDAPENRDNLAHFLDSVITHSTSAARVQMMLLKNDLLGAETAGQVRTLLRGAMQELVLHPADNLLTLALSNGTQRQLNQLLSMIIPAALNDSAIGQIGKLRSVLLGYNMKKDIAGWVDTALIVANRRLDSTLRPTIHSIVDENTSTIKKYAGSIITGLIVLAIIIGLVIYFIQHKKVLLNKSMLHQVAVQIERLKSSDPNRYEQLTGSIKEAMQNNQLEGDMNRFLKEERIS